MTRDELILWRMRNGNSRTLLDKTNSPLGIIVQFPIKKGPRTQSSLRTGLCAHIEQTLIKLQSTKSLVVQQSTKTPYLRVIGQDLSTEQQQEEGSPPSPSPSSNMSQDDDDFLDALMNQDDEKNEEEADGPLPELRIIWDCRIGGLILIVYLSKFINSPVCWKRVPACHLSSRYSNLSVVH